MTDGTAVDVALEPFTARALYAPSAVFETAGRLDEMLALLDRTEANAMVIDVKETDGRLYYATDLRPPPRSAPSARHRSSTSRSCCRCSRSAASTRSLAWS